MCNKMHNKVTNFAIYVTLRRESNQYFQSTKRDNQMNIYLGQQAKSLFYMREVPVESIGVFQCIGGDWVYWFNNGFTYDTGVADSEEEALQIAKKNFRPYKYDDI